MLELLQSLTQHSRLLRLTTSLGSSKLIVERMRGTESLSEPYEFKLDVLSTDAAIAAKSLMGQPALVELMTASSRMELRPFHGHVTAVESLGSDGGVSRYALTLSPWYAFLAYGRDSRVFQDKFVFDILDAIFGGWQSLGKLAPCWRFDIRDRAVYPRRSITTQYQESNLAFAERLMAEEGLFYYFEHKGDASSDTLGSHTMVIADHNGTFKSNAQPHVDYTQSSAVMKQDSVDRWRTEMKLLAGDIRLRSWDYRTLQDRPVGATSASETRTPILTSNDTPGAYAYPSREHGERVAQNQMQALDAMRETHIAAGTVRTFAPATTFTLHGQCQIDRAAGDDARTFVIVRVVHLAHNNLTSGATSALDHFLGQSPLQTLIDDEIVSSLHTVGLQKGERPLYRNRIDAIRKSVPFRHVTLDLHGALLHPRPRVTGQQTAIVVGPAGAPIHTDRNHRIKVQFHWQRGAGEANLSHSRLNHPAPDGQVGAPGNDLAGTWVRVATALAPVAGANWGACALPRVGSEVLIDFIDGNIDRPVIIGAVYNGRGLDDAQQNAVGHGAGIATGNAAAWFPGGKGAHAHPAVLSGLKSQALAASQHGCGGYGQLVFDDSHGKSRTVLQHHAVQYRGAAELNLGHLQHQADNQRLNATGFGAELIAAHGVALRAGKGMLLSADALSDVASCQLDSADALAQNEACRTLQASLASSAHQHLAKLTDRSGKMEGEPATIAAIAEIAKSLQTLRGKDDGATSLTSSMGGGSGVAIAYAQPQLQLSAPGGVAVSTPVSTIFAAGGTSSITAGQDINLVSQANSFGIVSGGIALFTSGQVSQPQKPNQESGISLHAATGKVSSQSQGGETRLTADKAIIVSSVSKSLTIGAKKHVRLTAQGAFLKLEGGNIMLHGPGKIEFKASMKQLSGPQAAYFVPPKLPFGEIKPTKLILERLYHDNEPLAGAPFQVTFADGSIQKGRLDGAGRSVLDDVPPGAASVFFGPMPGKFERKDQEPMPSYNPAPCEKDIDALLDKYWISEEPRK